jgi:hypothetical protein
VWLEEEFLQIILDNTLPFSTLIEEIDLVLKQAAHPVLTGYFNQCSREVYYSNILATEHLYSPVQPEVSWIYSWLLTTNRGLIVGFAGP